jgi:hypothetical protein
VTSLGFRRRHTIYVGISETQSQALTKEHAMSDQEEEITPTPEQQQQQSGQPNPSQEIQKQPDTSKKSPSQDSNPHHKDQAKKQAV